MRFKSIDHALKVTITVLTVFISYCTFISVGIIIEGETDDLLFKFIQKTNIYSLFQYFYLFFISFLFIFTKKKNYIFLNWLIIFIFFVIFFYFLIYLFNPFIFMCALINGPFFIFSGWALANTILEEK